MFQLGLIIIYSGLLFATLFLVFVKSKHFLLVFMLLMSVSPNVQYLLVDTTGVYFHDTTFERMILEIINVIILVGYILYNKIHLRSFHNNKFLWLVLALYIVFHVPNIILAYDIEKSFIIFMISVVGPSLLFYIIVNDRETSLLSTFKKDIYIFITGFLMLGIVSITYYILKKGGYNPLLMRTAGGMYMTNFSIALLSLFLPFVFLNDKAANRKTKLFQSISFIGIVLLLSASISRLGLLSYSLYFFYCKMRSVKSFLVSIFVVAGLIFIIVNEVEKYTEINMIEAFQYRLAQKDETALENAKDDERLRLYSVVYRTIRNTPHLLFTGVGIANFSVSQDFLVLQEKDKSLFNYSNAHSILFNMLFERGIVIVFFFWLFIYSTLKRRKFVNKDKYAFKAFYHGVVLFLVITFFYMDLFVVSANHNGLAGYFLFISLGFITRIKNSRNLNLST